MMQYPVSCCNSFVLQLLLPMPLCNHPIPASIHLPPCSSFHSSSFHPSNYPSAYPITSNRSTLSFSFFSFSSHCSLPVGGAGIWCKNFDALAADRTVYAIDMIGFGRSSRPVFSSDPAESESLFVSSFESWRRAMELPSFILAGHSLGGFVSAAYTLQHPSRVEHLILLDCWGMPERPESGEETRVKLPSWALLIGKVAHMFSPLSGIRLLGPLGKYTATTLMHASV